MKFELNASKRELQGSGASRRLRRANKVPGIIYGGVAAPALIELDHNDILLALRKEDLNESRQIVFVLCIVILQQFQSSK